MNKKGFTLIELLCVIILLALITVISSTGIMKLSKSSKEKLYCAKVDLIKTLAKDYGERYEKEINESTTLYEGYKSLKIKVQTLVENGVLEPDKDNLIINPINQEKMNDLEIILFLKNNQIYAVFPNNIC